MRRTTKSRGARTVLVGTAVALLAVGGVGCASEGGTTVEATSPVTTPDDGDEAAEPASRTITVTGEGSVTVKPDIARVQMGVQVSGPTAQEALDAANEKAAALLAALGALGVAEEDLRTSGLWLFPTYDKDGQKVTGFQASNGVEVTIRDLARAGEIIDGGAAFAGEAITIGGISFAVDDPQAVMSEARADAVDNAIQRAGEFAAAAGVEVGDVVLISETGVSAPPSVFGEAATDAGRDVPISPGTTDLTVSVTVVFELL